MFKYKVNMTRVYVEEVCICQYTLTLENMSSLFLLLHCLKKTVQNINAVIVEVYISIFLPLECSSV